MSEKRIGALNVFLNENREQRLKEMFRWREKTISGIEKKLDQLDQASFPTEKVMAEIDALLEMHSDLTGALRTPRAVAGKAKLLPLKKKK